jgi:hypothetical protein
MSAVPKLATPDALLPAVDIFFDDAPVPVGDDAATPAVDAKNAKNSDAKVAENNSAAQPMPAPTATPNDPLSILKTMTEEEIIALFT